MKASGLIAAVLTLCAAFSCLSSPTVKQAQPQVAVRQIEQPVAVATATTLCDNALSARFLNMLNHNQSYDEDFYSFETLINNAVLSQLNLREGDYISSDYVADYLASMYGIQIDDFSEYNTDFPQKDGYVYIVPRGYTTYRHELISVTENEDGSYIVETRMTADAHDDTAVELKATTLFLPDEKSDYGFVMVYSNTAVSDNVHFM